MLTRFRQRSTETSNDIEQFEMLRSILPFIDYISDIRGWKLNQFKAIIQCKQGVSEDAIRAFMIQYKNSPKNGVVKIKVNWWKITGIGILFG